MKEKYIIGKNIDIKIINKKDIGELLKFQKEIIDEMNNKEWFVSLTEEEFLSSINGRDNAYFFMHDDKIVSLLVLTCDIPEVLEEYQLPSDNYMLIDSIMVNSEYRGHKLQRQMLQFAYKRAMELKMDGLVATVHPNNTYSLKNFVEEDYKILHLLQIHGGPRDILVKNIEM